jgi:hypothetical protein
VHPLDTTQAGKLKVNLSESKEKDVFIYVVHYPKKPITPKVVRFVRNDLL